VEGGPVRAGGDGIGPAPHVGLRRAIPMHVGIDRPAPPPPPLDGTHWSIDGDGESRVITIAIEKHFVPTSANMREGSVTYDASTVFDWGGVYPDDGGEVTRREYGEAEELDVREYAMKLGVDIG